MSIQLIWSLGCTIYACEGLGTLTILPSAGVSFITCIMQITAFQCLDQSDLQIEVGVAGAGDNTGEHTIPASGTGPRDALRKGPISLLSLTLPWSGQQRATRQPFHLLKQFCLLWHLCDHVTCQQLNLGPIYTELCHVVQDWDTL